MTTDNRPPMADYRTLRKALYEIKKQQYEKITVDADSIFGYFWMQGQMPQLSVNNILLLLHQCVGARDVRTYSEWTSADVAVKKGERALKIFKSYQKPDNTKRFKIVNVFDVAQTTKNYKWNPICDHPLTHVKALTMVANCEYAHYKENEKHPYAVSYIRQDNVFAVRLSEDHALLMNFAAENAVYRLREQNKLPYYLKDDDETKYTSARIAAQIYISRYGIRDEGGLKASMKTLLALNPHDREAMLNQARSDFIYIMEKAEEIFPQLVNKYPMRDETLLEKGR